MNKLFLGKKPADHNVKFKFTDFVDVKGLYPSLPKVFGHYGGINDWGMLGNDECGDCVWCSYAHGTMVWNKEAHTEVSFTKENTKADYSALTGYNGTEDTDNGTSMSDAANYRRKVGIIDSTGKRHKTEAYTSFHLGSNLINEILTGTYYFGCVDIGVELPKSAIDQFDRQQVWDVVNGSHNEGGHCITIVGRNSKGNLLAVTWGRLQAITPRFISQYCDEGQCSLSKEPLVPLSPEHYDFLALQRKLSMLAS